MLKWRQLSLIIIALTKRDNFIANSLHIFSVLEERIASRSSRSSRKHRSCPSSCDEFYYENTYNFQQQKLLTFCSPKQQRLTESLNLSTSAGRLTVKNKLENLKQWNTQPKICVFLFSLSPHHRACVRWSCFFFSTRWSPLRYHQPHQRSCSTHRKTFKIYVCKPTHDTRLKHETRLDF